MDLEQRRIEGCDAGRLIVHFLGVLDPAGLVAALLLMATVLEAEGAIWTVRPRDMTVPGRLTLGIVEGYVRRMHIAPENAGAVFQVASQFNLLEMTGPTVTPEHGVTGYAHDHTQGPACAIAAGAGTIWRNYIVPVGHEIGQTADRLRRRPPDHSAPRQRHFRSGSERF